MSRRDRGMVSMDNGTPIVLARRDGEDASTLVRTVKAGDQFLYTAAPLPEGSTVRIDSGPHVEIVTVAEALYSQVAKHFVRLVEPLTRTHAAGTPIVVLARKGQCPHFNAVPVETIDGETVAWLCPPPCDTQLPAEWKP